MESVADGKKGRLTSKALIFLTIWITFSQPRVSRYQEEKERKKQQFIILHLEMQLFFITLALPIRYFLSSKENLD